MRLFIHLLTRNAKKYAYVMPAFKINIVLNLIQRRCTRSEDVEKCIIEENADPYFRRAPFIPLSIPFLFLYMLTPLFSDVHMCGT